MDLPILDILCKYSHTVSFSLHNVFRVRTFYSMSQYFIPFYDYNIYMDIYHSLFIHLLLNIWPVSTFWLLWKILPEHGCASFCVNVCSSCLGYIPRSEIIESRDNSVPNCFPKQLYQFNIHTNDVWGFQFLHFLAQNYFCLSFWLLPSGRCEVISHCGLDLCFHSN